jgi:predicted N-formylglutamate amidohydrolase
VTTSDPPRFTLIVSSEHAGHEIPEELGRLGLGEDVLASHVAWDPGAKEVASCLASLTGAPLFQGRYSRLVADLNRSPGTSQVVPEIAFGVRVPGNVGLGGQGRSRREERYQRPYWRSVENAVAERMPRSEEGPRVLHLSIHSFTPELDGKKRSLDLGVLLDPDRPLEAYVGDRLLSSLREQGFDARENEPYDGRADGLVTAFRRMFDGRAYAGVEIEVSHRLLNDLDRVGRALFESLFPILGPDRRGRG